MNDLPAQADVLADLSNEYATIWLTLDRSANGPRLVVHSVRDHERIDLDPMALALLCHADADVFALLADIARDPTARAEFGVWMETQRELRRSDVPIATDARGVSAGSTTKER